MVSPKVSPDFFSTRTTNVGSGAISRSFLWPVRRELLWGSQLVPRLWLEGTNRVPYATFRRCPSIYFCDRPKSLRSSDKSLLNSLRLPPYTPVLDLEPRLRCRECAV